MSMQFTAYSIADLWGEGMKDFYLYELTKTNKVIKHKIRDLISFDESIIIAIGDEKGAPKHKLIFTSGANSKRIMGDSIYYTDFSAIKSQFNAKNGEHELMTEIEQLRVDVKRLKDVLTSKEQKYERLIEGMKAKYLQMFEESDKRMKDKITSYLQKKIYHVAPRYGSDLSFTFLIDRIFTHSTQLIGKQELIEMYKDTPNEELEKILSSSLVEIKN
jgi:hypothetical protein